MKTEKILNDLLEACDACSVAPEHGKEDGVDEGGQSRMAKSDLYNIAENAKMLHDMLEEDYPLEDWAEAKITKAADYVRSVIQYLKYEIEKEGEPADQEHSKIYIATDPRTLGL